MYLFIYLGNYSYFLYSNSGSNYEYLYMRPSNKSLVYITSNNDYPYSTNGNNQFPFYDDSKSAYYVQFISKDEEFRIMKNRTLTKLNFIFNYNTKLDLVGQSNKIDKADKGYSYVVLLSDTKLSVIYSNKTEDGYDTYKLIYNIKTVNNNPYYLNVTDLDYTASSFKLSNITCYEEDIQEDENKENNCGKNERIYNYDDYKDKYSKLKNIIFETPFVITITTINNKNGYVNEYDLTLQSDFINVDIIKKDKIEIDKKIEELLRTYKMKDHTYGIYTESEKGDTISFAGVSPAYLFSFYYSDEISDCGITTNKIDRFNEDDKVNVTTFDTEINDNHANIHEFCFSAMFDDRNVFCGDKSYDGNILIDEYVYDSSLTLLPTVSIFYILT